MLHAYNKLKQKLQDAMHDSTIFCAEPRIPLERIGIVDMGTPTTIISCRPIASITTASLCENAAIS